MEVGYVSVDKNGEIRFGCLIQSVKTMFNQYT